MAIKDLDARESEINHRKQFLDTVLPLLDSLVCKYGKAKKEDRDFEFELLNVEGFSFRLRKDWRGYDQTYNGNRHEEFVRLGLQVWHHPQKELTHLPDVQCLRLDVRTDTMGFGTGASGFFVRYFEWSGTNEPWMQALERVAAQGADIMVQRTAAYQRDTEARRIAAERRERIERESKKFGFED